jgi:hypothetical protein
MATETKILRVQRPVSDSPPTSFAKEHRTEEQHSIRISESERLTNSRRDFVLLHYASNVSWTTKVAERICGERFGN